MRTMTTATGFCAWLALTTLTIAPNATADAAEDARYIVAQTITEEMFSASLATLAPVLTSAIENDLRAKNIVVSDVETFSTILFEEFLAGFTEEMQSVTTTKYMELFSPRELADIAAFYRSDAGQSLLQKNPALMNFGAEQGRLIGAKAATDARVRIAQRLQEEGIEVTQPGQMDELIEALK